MASRLPLGGFTARVPDLACKRLQAELVAEAPNEDQISHGADDSARHSPPGRPTELTCDERHCSEAEHRYSADLDL
jgi:hypothetical protein